MTGTRPAARVYGRVMVTRQLTKNADPANGFYAVVMLDPEGNEFCVA